MSKVEYAVVIGRFQPFHNGHKELIDKAFDLAHQVIVVIGSAYAARTIKNPFTLEERSRMISTAYNHNANLHIVGVSDFFYNENKWFESVKTKVGQITGFSTDVVLVGHVRDNSSYYVTRFSPWKFVEAGVLAADANATAVRSSYLETGAIAGNLPSFTERFLSDFKFTPIYQALAEEYKSINEYQDSWASSPYPPTFVTADTVVHKSGHILLVRRNGGIGKGLWALPGGFVNNDESVEQAAIRELREESNIKILPDILKSSIKETKIFDYPYRSLRGRTITVAHFLDLGEGPLPPVLGGDDAGAAAWFSITDIYMMQNKIFEDHASIIHYFTSKF